MHARERLIVEELPGERFVAVREPAPDLGVWRGCGPERGAWEEAHANDNAVAVEYSPPPWRVA